MRGLKEDDHARYKVSIPLESVFVSTLVIVSAGLDSIGSERVVCLILVQKSDVDLWRSILILSNIDLLAHRPFLLRLGGSRCLCILYFPFEFFQSSKFGSKK